MPSSYRAHRDERSHVVLHTGIPSSRPSSTAAGVAASLSAMRASIDDAVRGNSSYNTAVDSIAQHNESADVILRSADGDSYDAGDSSQPSGSIQRTYDADNVDIGTAAGNPGESMSVDVDITDGEDDGGSHHGAVDIAGERDVLSVNKASNA